MSGLLAWAADVVGGGGNQIKEDAEIVSIPLIFTPEQQKYVQELDRKAASLSRSVQELRLRLPPPDISQRLPHIHAHSLASNADLALQLNAHSATRQQVQQREVTLQEESAQYEKAISNFESKIQEKKREADLLQKKLEQLSETEQYLEQELENAANSEKSQSSGDLASTSLMTADADEEDAEAVNSALFDELEDKKKELSSAEELVKMLEKKWAEVQENALRQPSPAQREKMLDKQLHSLIEQLAAKQAQAESLVSEIHLKQMELEKQNALLKRSESRSAELGTARNRLGRNLTEKSFSGSDFIDSQHKLPYYADARSESQQRSMLLRSSFVLYILALHILVFIKISF